MMSVLLTLDVFMVHAIALGNVTASLDGVEYYVTKVMTVLLYFFTKNMELPMLILLKLVVKQ